MKIVLVHDHLAQDGGAERVLRELAAIYPEAPIYTLLYEKEVVDKVLPGRQIEASIIQKLPGGVKHYQWYMPFMPMAVEFFDLRGYDVVLSDASAFAKGVITSPDTLHICYCHTPTRYIWDYTHQYINELKYNKYFKKIISLVLNYIRIWDRQAADRVDEFIANSETVKKRIKKYYRRDSVVIYPPVEIDKFKIVPKEEIDDYFLIGGRLAPYKRVDLAIKVFKRLKKKLKVFGDGVDLERLKKIAGQAENIEFLGDVRDEEKIVLFNRALAFLNPQEEDFGITVVEAMAAGRPVIAYGRGGARETIIDGRTGLFFNEQSVDSMAEAIMRFDPEKFNPEEIRKQAEKFSQEKFRSQIKSYVDQAWEKFKKS